MISLLVVTDFTACPVNPIPAGARQEFEKVYPFGWLGVLSETPPLKDIIYNLSRERFRACLSTLGPRLSRYYVQCPASDRVEDWSDDRFWEELKSRFPEEIAAEIITGPST